MSADFSILRYAQCWEDADVLLDALAIEAGDTCVSIASAGDNTLSMLTCDPARVIAVDLNPTQLAALRLRLVAYRELEHGELLQLLGSRPATASHRSKLYARCRPALDAAARAYWDARGDAIAHGVGDAGKFEGYFRLFRRWCLPLVHGPRAVEALLTPRGDAERAAWYARHWDHWRWRALFSVFFSRTLMGALGRDPAMFAYVQGSVADRIRARTDHALRDLDPSENPYVHWILRGTHGHALPHALRAANFATIRSRLDRIEIREASLGTVLDELGPHGARRFNLSDIFEYLSVEETDTLLRRITEITTRGARLVYWNMLAPRERPASLADRLRSHTELARQLHARDRAFFYSRLVIEERTEA